MTARNALLARDVDTFSPSSESKVCKTRTVAVRLACVVAFALTGIARAQVTDTFLNQQRNIQEEIRQKLDEELTTDMRTAFDFGGSYSFYLFLYDDGANSSRTLRRHDGRLWVRGSLDQGTHEAYARARLSFVDFNTGDGIGEEFSLGDGFKFNDDDWEGPNLERGFYQFSLRKAMKAYGKQNVPYDFRVKAGRQYVELGTGYAMSMPLDAILITGEAANFEVTGLISQTIRSTNDIDLTRPGADESYRSFFGVQVKYLGLMQHKPFFYAFWNEDQMGEEPIDLLQNYDYDSYYLGFGSTGAIISNDVGYSAEFVFEGGQSYGNERFMHTDEIDAWAFDLMVEYLMPVPSKPRFMAEYMFASGDGDRLGSPTDAIGGNRNDHHDTSFVAFGFRDTSLAFAPSLSNIHIWRTGASFFPFHKYELFDELEVGTDWFLFWKHHKVAAVSDPLADMPDGYLGWEMDYFLNWRITSDLSWTTRYGAFFPGSAFSDQTCRYFFLTGLTWSF